MELKKMLGLLVLLQACPMVASGGAKKKKAAPAVYGNTPQVDDDALAADMEFLELPPSTASACAGSTKTGAKKKNIGQ